MGQSSDFEEDFDSPEYLLDLPESRIAPTPPLLARRHINEMGYRRALVDQQPQAQSLPLFGLLGSGGGGGVVCWGENWVKLCICGNCWNDDCCGANCSDLWGLEGVFL